MEISYDWQPETFSLPFSATLDDIIPPEGVKQFNGRDALLRVRDGKPKTDAEHRVPIRSDLRASRNHSQLP